MSYHRREQEQVTDASNWNQNKGVFGHVDTECWTYFDTLNKAQTLYMNSMRIPLDAAGDTKPLDDGGPMQVKLRIDLQNGVVSHTLSIQVSPGCVKQFAFKGGMSCGVPCSPKRLTSVSIEFFKDGQQSTGPEVRSFVCDKRLRASAALGDGASIEWCPGAYVFCTVVHLEGCTQTLNFPCYKYEGDECPSTWIGDFSLSTAFTDFGQVLSQACLTPSGSLTVLAAVEAESKLALFESNVADICDVFDAVFADTARRELGAQEGSVDAIKNEVDWRRSYTVTSDARVSDLIRFTKSMYTQLSALSNTAVKDCWLRDTAVQGLLASRAQLAESVRGRRSRTDQVLDVRSSFICIDAIDGVLRGICSHGDEEAAAARLEYPALLDIPCHEYYLQQLQCNTHNSIPFKQQTFDASQDILRRCRAVHESGLRLLPHSTALATASKASALGCKIWQHMHLQGLVAQHALIAAPAPHFVYKRRGCIDFKKHPVVRSLLAQASAASDGDRQLALHKQVGAVALLAKLVTLDAEHRIIPAIVATRILALVESATAPAAAEATRQDASEFLARVFHPKVHSLVNGALGKAVTLDTAFITNPDYGEPMTGYNMEEVTSFCLQGV